MYTKKSKLTDAERVRLDEISFCFFILRLAQTVPDPTKLYDFIEVVCSFGDCNFVIIANLVSICMTKDRRYFPSKEEHVQLLAKSDIPVRKATKILGISQRDYYNYMYQEQLPIEPKFEPRQYIEIIKFLDAIQNIIPERI